MKRRDFLKILTVAPLAPSVLAAIPALPKTPEKLIGNSIDWVMYDEEPAPWLNDMDIYLDNDLLHRFVYCNFVCSQPNTHGTLTTIS